MTSENEPILNGSNLDNGNTFMFPPEHVITAFSLEENTAQVLSIEENTILYGDIVLCPIYDYARASWSAEVREHLLVPGLRIAKPVRGSDGRFVVSGWKADIYLPGVWEDRVDEIISCSYKLHSRLLITEKPRFITNPLIEPYSQVDLFTIADRSAWEDKLLEKMIHRGLISKIEEETDQNKLERKRSFELFQLLSSQKKDLRVVNQLVHGDFYSSVLFDGDKEPGLTDIVPYFRPQVWASALCAIDGLIWSKHSTELLERWEDHNNWKQLLIRAMLFRLAVHIVNQEFYSSVIDSLHQAAVIVDSYCLK